MFANTSKVTGVAGIITHSPRSKHVSFVDSKDQSSVASDEDVAGAGKELVR